MRAGTVMTTLLIGIAHSSGALLATPSSLPSPQPVGCASSSDLGAVVALNKGLVNTLKGSIDLMYKGRDIERFYVLETIARVPYFSYLSCLHLYESLGMRDHVRHMRLHYAEADNELHHLLIMESLGGNRAFGDRFVAQHIAFFYFWYCVGIYILSPKSAYHLSELIEEHAYKTYDGFLRDNEQVLRSQPVPAIAAQYYSGSDALEAFMRQGQRTNGEPVRQPRPLHSLYDVFCEVRDDEAAHWRTLVNLVSRPHEQRPRGLAARRHARQRATR